MKPGTFIIIAVIALLAGIVIGVVSCTDLPTAPSVGPAPAPEPIVLQWEVSHPERAAWTKELLADIRAKLDSFDKAKDVGLFCPKYGALGSDDRIHAMAVLMEWISNNESGWNPGADGNVKNTDGTVPSAVGLFQIGIGDPPNYSLAPMTKADLQDPIKNIRAAVWIMAFQLDHVGLLAVPMGGKYLFWATLHPGGKYDQSKNIQAMVQKLSFCK